MLSGCFVLAAFQPMTHVIACLFRLKAASPYRANPECTCSPAVTASRHDNFPAPKILDYMLWQSCNVASMHGEALQAHPDGFSCIYGDLVICGISVGKAQVKVLDLQVQVW